jgi:hypothetical protein
MLKAQADENLKHFGHMGGDDASSVASFSSAEDFDLTD